MDWTSVAAIIVGFITLLGTLWVQILQFKKDRQQYEHIHETCKEIKADNRDTKNYLSGEHNKLSWDHKDLSREHREICNKVDEIITNQKIDSTRRDEAAKKLPKETEFVDAARGMLSTINKMVLENERLKEKIIILEAENYSLKANQPQFSSYIKNNDNENIDDHEI